MKQSFYKWMKWNRSETITPMTSSLYIDTEMNKKDRKEREKEKKIDIEKDPLPQTELFYPLTSPIQNYEQRQSIRITSASTDTQIHHIELPIESSPPLSPIHITNTTESCLSLYLNGMYKCMYSQVQWCILTLCGKYSV